VSNDRTSIDTSNVQLDSGITALTEVLARHIHHVWVRERGINGWVYGPKRNDDRREHPCMVSYERLPESEREYDRRMALEALRAMIALGYRINRPTSDT
jgi:hypothetical protein